MNTPRQWMVGNVEINRTPAWCPLCEDAAVPGVHIAILRPNDDSPWRRGHIQCAIDAANVVDPGNLLPSSHEYKERDIGLRRLSVDHGRATYGVTVDGVQVWETGNEIKALGAVEFLRAHPDWDPSS